MDICAFGEILWDVFAEKSVIGGAPFNFSAHLARLGAAVSLVTSVGNDALGSEACRILRSYGVRDDYVQMSGYPTGTCNVILDGNGSPQYFLRPDTAYDHITLTGKQLDNLRRRPFRAFYFGTLAQRNEVSRKTVSSILANGSFEQVLFDVNIRQSFYERPMLEDGLKACTILKVSREEAGVFEETGLAGAFHNSPDGHKALCRELARKYGIGLILFTLDKDGALVYQSKTDTFFLSEKPRGKVISTVGAGDSFSACFLFYCLSGQPIEVCLNKAVVLSDFVVQHTEAVPAYTKQLRNFLS